jgi:hypothetical protein
MLDTYLLGINGLGAGDPQAFAWLRAGTHLAIRRGEPSNTGEGGRRLEVCAPDGRALGYLPPEDARLVAELLEAGAAVKARVKGLVPAFWRPRVQIEIEVEEHRPSRQHPALTGTGTGRLREPCILL